MKRDSYANQQSHTSFQPQSPHSAIDQSQLGQPTQHSSSTSAVGSNWLNRASSWVADKFQTVQNFVDGSGDTILQRRGYANAPDQILPALKGTAKPSRSQTDSTNQPLVGVIDAGFGTDEHGRKMVEAIQKENPQAKIWQGGGVGAGGGLESLVEFVDVAKATGHSRAVANLSFDLTEVHPDGNTSTRTQLTTEEQSALAYARDNGVLVVASSGNQGGAMSALGQASQPSDNLIVVGAANGSDRASYSSYGKGLDLVADVGAAGTSLAAAKVTGSIAKIWSANPELSSQQVNQLLTTTATDLKTPGRDAETGAGLLNATGAIDLATHPTPKSIVFSGAQLVQQVPESEPLAGATWESRNGSVASERTNRPIEGDGPRISAQSASAQRAVAPRRRAPLNPPRPVPPTPEQRAAGQRANELHRQGERTPLPPRPPAPPTAAQRAAGQRAVALRRQEERASLTPPRPAPPTAGQRANELHRQGERTPLPPRPPAPPTAGQRAAGQRANELHRQGERTPLPPRPAPPTAAPQATNPLDVRRAGPAAPENPPSRSTPAQRRQGERDPLTPPRPAQPTPVPDTNGYEVISDVGHTVLDVLGVTPIGPVADIANAIWYAAEGDLVNAGTSILGVVPGGGDAATTARLANRAYEAYSAAEEARGTVEGVFEVAQEVHNGNFVGAGLTLFETASSIPGRGDRPTGRSAGNDRNGELNAGGISNTPQNPPRNGGSPSRSGSEPDARGRRDDRGRPEENIRDQELNGDRNRPSTDRSIADIRDQELVTVGVRNRDLPSTDHPTAGSRDREPVAVGGGNGGTRPSNPSTAAAKPAATTRDRNSRADSAPAPQSGSSGGGSNRKPPTGGGGSRPTGGYDDSNNNGLPAGNGGNSAPGRVIYPRGQGASEGPVPPGYVRVSRWVNENEVNLWMQNEGTAIPTAVGTTVPSSGRRIYVTLPGAPQPGGTGPVRIDFSVDQRSLAPAGNPEWRQIFGPVSNMPIYNVKIHLPPE